MLRTQLEAISDSIDAIGSFFYGTPNEINYKIDDASLWPVCCVYPVQPVETILGVNGSADNTYNLYIEFLYPTKFEKNSEDNEVLVTQALSLANKYLVSLRDYRAGDSRYFKWENKKITARSMPIYNRYDVNTTGVNLTFRVGTMFDDYLLNCTAPDDGGGVKGHI